jgi:cation-transporting P-type ATPase E
VRDGQVQNIAASEVVLEDLLLLASGESIVADGTVIESRYLEIDEALLTGESDPVRRQSGDTLLSGSFCVAGEGSYRADRVGPSAFAQSTAAQARSYHVTASPLTRTINLLIQILTYTAVALCLVYVLLDLLGRTTEGELIQNMAATITSMVPQGLVLTATLSFTLGAVRMSTKGAIVQRLNAVETMAAIDVMATDKTGTLTTNQLRLDQTRAVGNVDETDANHLLGVFAATSLDNQNKTIHALRAALGGNHIKATKLLPFKSQNRYSAASIRDGIGERILALGAPEALRPHLDAAADTAWEQAYSELLPTGLRLLLFADSTGKSLGDTLDGISLRPLLLVGLSDELRPEASQVLEALSGQGIDFKIISGDNPATVRATLSHIKLPLAHEPVVTGDELASAKNPAELISQHAVFGRMAPLQKVQIIQTLQQQRRHVAMIGDGVNDVLPIKRADLGIAMGSGSQAAKTVAGIVLEHDNFALLPDTLEEGRTIVRNLRRAAKLFLVKNVYSLLLILAYASGIFGVPFPYEPQQVTLLNWLVIGIPAFAIALSQERSTQATKQRFLQEVGWFAVRTGVVFAAAGIVLLMVASRVLECDVKTQRTLLLSILIVLGISALFRVLRDGENNRLKGDTRFRLLALAAIPAYLAAMYVPQSAYFFQLVPLTGLEWLLTLVVAVPAVALTLVSDWGKSPKSEVRSPKSRTLS